MLKIQVTVEFDEEQVRDLFDAREIKYTKKKFKELKDLIDDDPSLIDELISEHVDELISELFED